MKKHWPVIQMMVFHLHYSHPDFDALCPLPAGASQKHNLSDSLTGQCTDTSVQNRLTHSEWCPKQSQHHMELHAAHWHGHARNNRYATRLLELPFLSPLLCTA